MTVSSDDAEAKLRNKLRAILEDKDWSYADLARRIGKSEDAVKKMMVSHGLKQYVKLADLCRALDVTPSELLGFNEPADPVALLAAMSVSFEALGLGRQDADDLAEIVLEAAKGAHNHAGELPLAATARVLAAANVSKFRKK